MTGTGTQDDVGEADVPSPMDLHPDRRVAAMRRLRGEGPVVPLPEAGPVVAAVRYEAVNAGLRRIDDFGGSVGQDDVADVDKHVAALREPAHSQVRRVINGVVAFHKSQQIEPYLQGLVDSTLDDFLAEAATAGDAGVDLVAHLASPLPPSAMARLMGFPEEDAARYYEWLRESGGRMQQAAQTGKSIAIADANPRLTAYVDEQIAARRALSQDEWPQDALTRFLRAEIDGEPLDDRSVRAQILFMIGAGTDTTKNLIGSLFDRLARAPEAYAALRADRSLVDAAVEEALRLDAPAQFMVRTCQHATELEGTPIERGQRVFMCIGSANHDDAVFDDADEFRLDREKADHLSFGSGSHICAGAALARLEVRTLLRSFLGRVVAFHLVDPDHFEPRPSPMSQGPIELRVVLDEVAP
ncbi:MAG TPA: cytochrome P450 [Acidimicrobiales bacterium]